MSLVSSHNLFTNSLPSSSTELVDERTSPDPTEVLLTKLLGDDSADSEQQYMERSANEYTQPGIHSPYSHALNDAQSEEPIADHASASNSNRYSNSATPTSEYGVHPASARSGSYPEHLHRQYHHPASNHNGSSGGGMAQPTSPSMPLQDGRPNHQNAQIKSDEDVPIDPSIAASSPTYPPHGGGQYSPYPPQQDMQHGYPSSHPGGAMYPQPRPDWAGYAGQPQHPMHGGYPVSGAQTPTSQAPAGARPGQVGTPDQSEEELDVEEPKSREDVASEQRGFVNKHLTRQNLPRSTDSSHSHPQQQTVYSFVPIPGAQQHKRPRRRYEEIERMYKCGWNGCEKAYGTLNHLNAHVTMQSHGQKRTPEEFKEIRKEWKARKKEEENQRKAEEERARASAPADGQGPEGNAPPAYQQGRPVQLPPIGYQPGAQVPGQYQNAPPSGVHQLQEYPSGGNMAYGGYPASPYGAPNQMYNQHNGAPPQKYEH